MRRQLAIKNRDPNDPNDLKAGGQKPKGKKKGRVGPAAMGQRKRTDRKQFFIFCCKLTTTRNSAGEPMFYSIPFTPRNVQATESRLKAVYDAAKLGLKGDSLALAAGMLPTEYRQLTQLDPVVEMAAQKGKADAEIEMANVVRGAALQGDAKMALEVLKHQHGWVAKQAISVEVDQRISITGALAEAAKRLDVIDVEDAQIIEPSVQHAIDHIQR
jgi:hypothetical protein